GKLGFIFFRSNGAPLGQIANDGTLITVCFTVIGDLGECSPLIVTNDPSAVGAENANGFVGMTIDTGSVCIGFLPLKLDLAIIKPTCTGQATLQAVPSGGNDPYDISWTALTGGGAPGSGTVTAQGDTLKGNLTQNGMYEVCVTDQEGAKLCDTIEMKVPILGANVTFEQPKCFGDSTGSVTANVLINGIAAPDPSLFKYDWAPAGLTTQNVPVQTNVPAGTYSVTVTEPTTGCFHVASGTMGSPAPVSDQLVDIMAASCNGIEDGTVSYIAEGGTPFPGTAYKYEWAYSSTANGTFTPFLTVTENPSVLNSRANGYYRVTITDANGCTFTDDLQITTQRTISINVGTVKGPNCAGGMDGSISIAMSETPALPGANYAFIWVQTGGTENSTATTSTLSGLKAGTYGITAIENSGCADTATITITDPPKLVLDTVDLKNPTCVQPNSGSITVSVKGGTPTSANVYSMFWSSALPSGNAIYAQAALGAGTYSVTAVDSKGCRDSLMLTLSLPPAPVIKNVVTTPVKCGKDGCLEIVTDAAGPMFTWQQLDSTAVLGTAAKICSLDGGQYVITLKDANSCVTVDTFSLTPVVPLSIDTATLNPPKCFGDANGSIIPTISGGQPTYKYAWNTVPPSSLPALNQVKAGQYTLTVTDLKGCTDVKTFNLSNPPSINAYYSDAKAATCSDTCNGAASIVVNYSDGSKGDFLFQWSGTPASTDSVRTDLCPGMYTVTVVATVNSCSRLVDVFVGSPQPISATALDSVSVTCNGDADGEASIAVAGGTSPYKFIWSTGGQTNTIKNLEAGPYAVTVTDKNNCKKTFSLTVPEPAPIVVATSLVDQPKCFGNSNGSLGVEATGGNAGAYTYAWKREADQSLLGGNNPIDFLRAGYYSVTVTDPKGCTGSLDSIVLSDPPPVRGDIQGYEPLKCFGDQTLISVSNVMGGAGAPYFYSVDNGATLPVDVPFTIDGGEHTITYSDSKNCEFTDTITIAEPAEITVKFIPEEVEIGLGDSLLLKPVITGADISNIVWTPADVLSRPDSIITYARPFRSTMITLTVSDANGCSGTGKITILVDPNRNVYMPNVFKAGNPAGTNNAFSPWVGPGVRDVNFFQVYDRWGELLYERTNFIPDNDNLEEGWDGRYKGDFVNPGVYIYVLEVDFLDGRTLLYRGDVTVVR
ncbi:MAG TPA: gliding motility-associated C-terminal domain-containing protein, partial [Saprospiraceae bacterium]|nr:gliding motility-associated C-terminal domain-containing protein [Saprospiraceae bacterium]